MRPVLQCIPTTFRAGLVACLLAGSALLAVPAIADDGEVLISGYLSQLSEAEGFEVQGLNILGGEVFLPPRREKPAEQGIARALARFNYVAHYQGSRLDRIVILGRKGADVGALPESYSEPVPASNPDE